MKKKFFYSSILSILIFSPCKALDAPISSNITNNELDKKTIEKNHPKLDEFQELASQSSSSLGDYSISLGQSNQSIEAFSFTTGKESISLSRFSHAHGRKNIVNSDFSYAFGDSNQASGYHSYAHGKRNSSKGLYSLSFGKDNSSDGSYSFTFGNKNAASNFGFAFGSNNNILGSTSGAFGKSNTIEADNSFSIGSNNLIKSEKSYSLGSNNELNSSNSFALGNNIISQANNNITIGGGESKLINNIANSLMVGFNSSEPTLFVSSSLGLSNTGTVGIGTKDINENVKLHVKGQILIDDGNQNKNFILSTDEEGKARWSNPKELGIVVRDKKTHNREKYLDELQENIQTNLDGDLDTAEDARLPALFINREEEYDQETDTILSNINIGVGTSAPQQTLHILGALRLEPLEEGPKNASAGDIYYDKSGAFCGFVIDSLGYSSWEKIVGSGDCSS